MFLSTLFEALETFKSTFTVLKNFADKKIWHKDWFRLIAVAGKAKRGTESAIKVQKGSSLF